MTSTVQVKRSEAGGRDVYSISKTYRGEEHEVIFPLDQDMQVLVNLISTINEDKPREEQFVLMRRNAVGRVENDGIDTKTMKTAVLQAVVRELFDDEIAGDVMEAVRDE